jgi:hypothetical protein
MKRLMWYVSCCMMPLFGASATYANPEVKSSANTAPGNAASFGRLSSTNYSQSLAATPMVASDILAQVPPPPPAPTTTPPAPTAAPTTTPASSDPETQKIQEQLNNIKDNKTPTGEPLATYNPKTSPAFSIFNPTGFGADNNLIFFAIDYQSRTRFTRTSDGEAGIGVGLGDAVNGIGVEISYGLNSFGTSQGFGSGAFSAKVHKRLSEDTSVAIGWNQFAQVRFGGGTTDYPSNSYYAVGTKILRTVEDINQPFSRLALSAGVGSGIFLPYDSTVAGLNRTGLNVFGSVGVRIARPVSAVVEWTGQDLAAGVSIAPFENFPLVITPALRDITGAGDGARFVLGASVAFKF